VDNSDKHVKEQVEPIDLSFIIFDSGIGPLKLLLITLNL
jgi:hypothetical protein